MMNKMVIIGGGGHAKVVISVLRKLEFELLGYTDFMNKGTILGVPYLGDDDVLPKLIRVRDGCMAALGLGKIDASGQRRLLQARLEALGFEYPTILSPHATINEEVTLGAGTVAFDGVVVNSGTTTGSSCILNTSCTIDHDCRLGDNVHIAPNATLSGGAIIGDNCLIGAGATIIQEVTVCAGCVIGAGSTVITDIVAQGTYAGSPARRIR